MGTKEPKWRKIADNKVLHIWKKENDHTCHSPKEVTVSPNWYQDNGTPICGCGEDMVYSHTEILK